MADKIAQWCTLKVFLGPCCVEIQGLSKLPPFQSHLTGPETGNLCKPCWLVFPTNDTCKTKL